LTGRRFRLFLSLSFCPKEKRLPKTKRPSSAYKLERFPLQNGSSILQNETSPLQDEVFPLQDGTVPSQNEVVFSQIEPCHHKRKLSHYSRNLSPSQPQTSKLQCREFILQFGSSILGSQRCNPGLRNRASMSRRGISRRNGSTPAGAFARPHGAMGGIVYDACAGNGVLGRTMHWGKPR
jgi:hypothetical protein